MKIPIESLKKLSIVLTYTERLSFVFFQKNHENLFNEIKTVLLVSMSVQLTTFRTWISYENSNRIIKKSLNIVFTCTERLSFVFFQINV